MLSHLYGSEIPVDVHSLKCSKHLKVYWLSHKIIRVFIGDSHNSSTTTCSKIH